MKWLKSGLSHDLVVDLTIGPVITHTWPMLRTWLTEYPSKTVFKINGVDDMPGISRLTHLRYHPILHLSSLSIK